MIGKAHITALTIRITSYNVCYTKLLRSVSHLKYPDHYNFNRKDIAGIQKIFAETSGNKIIIVTENVITSYSIHYTKLYDHNL